ncbi:MAG: cysteine hydrolase [Deltaproteobacteria bacterium]|nr:cysteine hydrolase [Deltaproteobacteria bacterium]
MGPYVTTESLAAKTARWLDQIAEFNCHRMTLNRSGSALLVIDMQRFFLEPESASFTCGGPAILPTVKRLIDAFRSRGRPVIYTRHVHHPQGNDLGIMGWWWQDNCVEGTPGSEIAEPLSPLPTEKVVVKHRYSAFFDTDLETVLRCLKIEDLVICGVMTNMCCESTARDAYFRDYRVFFPADANGTISEEMQVASLLNLAFGFAQVTTSAEVIAGLSA